MSDSHPDFPVSILRKPSPLSYHQGTFFSSSHFYINFSYQKLPLKSFQELSLCRKCMDRVVTFVECLTWAYFIFQFTFLLHNIMQWLVRVFASHSVSRGSDPFCKMAAIMISQFLFPRFWIFFFMLRLSIVVY